MRRSLYAIAVASLVTPVTLTAQASALTTYCDASATPWCIAVGFEALGERPLSGGGTGLAVRLTLQNLGVTFAQRLTGLLVFGAGGTTTDPRDPTGFYVEANRPRFTGTVNQAFPHVGQEWDWMPANWVNGSWGRVQGLSTTPFYGCAVPSGPFWQLEPALGATCPAQGYDGALVVTFGVGTVGPSRSYTGGDLQPRTLADLRLVVGPCTFAGVDGTVTGCTAHGSAITTAPEPSTYGLLGAGLAGLGLLARRRSRRAANDRPAIA